MDADLSHSPEYGLSPRVRGNHSHRLQIERAERSIPACAGEPMCGRFYLIPWTVYPRVCGGTTTHIRGRALFMGLSPRVRGNRCARVRIPTARRSIPACAGEPKASPDRRFLRGVYPRVCGGTAPPDNRQLTGTGLSPRVRGNLLFVLCINVYDRSIPACAGEPRPPRDPVSPEEVYPRVCGEPV